VRDVEALLVAVLGGDLVEEVLGESLAAGGVAGEEAERLDVEDEVGRGAVDPEAGLLLAGEVVVGGVDLDDGELGGVEAQARLGVVGALGVPAGFEQGRVGPGGGPDPDRSPAGAGLAGHARQHIGCYRRPE
jgi:hypothetical protein